MPKSKAIKIIIDTNLFVSFLIGKRLKKLKQLLINSQIKLIFSEQNILELKLVTDRPKFRKYFNKNDVLDLIDLMYSIGKIVKVTKQPKICRDPKDNFLLGLSDLSKADYLVSSDKDLLEVHQYKTTKIIGIDELERILEDVTLH
ncbi:MAG: putative toxin-antitoxin system toxin component, PIN family [Bacteroidales bacterium]|nr:putative toxin-antitoxin system toxin component, PIN family [Bacteroidales bacterium]